MGGTCKTVFTIRHFSASRPPGLQAPTHVEINGDLNIGSAAGFRVVLGDLVDNEAVLVDLTGCDMVDGAGLQALVGEGRRYQAAGGQFNVTGAPPAVATAIGSALSGSPYSSLGSAPREWWAGCLNDLQSKNPTNPREGNDD